MSRARVTAAIFLIAAAVLLAFHGQRMVFTNDEGIVLEAAQRMASGARLYVDFFGYMSPGSYWLQEIVFRLLGVALWTGRLIVILDFALQCALVYWLTAFLSSWRAAAAVTLIFAGFQLADPAFLTSAHRWDSATLALAGLCLAVRGERAWRWMASGALLAAAVWCTPSLALLAAVVGLWLAISGERRGSAVPFAAGAAAVGLAGIGALLSTDSLAAFFAQMAWLRQNYSGVNVLPYGSIIGGYRALFEGSQGMLETAVRAVLVACVALPAILPPAAIVLAAILVWRARATEHRDVLILLMAAVAGLTLTALPRADVMHLAFVAALPYALAGAALARLLPARAGSWLALGALVLAGVFASNSIRGWREARLVSSPAGVLRVPAPDAADVQRMIQAVRPGNTLFVYPYMPVEYFLTQTRNPTRYSYLMPGMMTHTQELDALQQLQAQPPQWLLFLQLAPEDFLRAFPNGAGLDWHFAELESWMQTNYQPMDAPAITVGGYRLWRRIDSQAAGIRP